MRKGITFGLMVLVSATVTAREFHVSKGGHDANDGSASAPFQTISAAARVAQPGDTITMHAGIYRERIDPPRGGTSDRRRIVYQAAPGEKVFIRGSEPITGWQRVRNDTWKVTIPNAFFGNFNPYADEIHGDWFNPRGRKHHTGAVYLNGHWLTEAAKLEHVLAPIGAAQSSYTPGGGGVLLNVAWFQPGNGSAKTGRIAANRFAGQHGIKTAPCSEGGECIGWIEPGDWVQYKDVDLGEQCGQITFRAASATRGGVIEIRLDKPAGELLGTCTLPNTGDWQAWRSFPAKIKPSSGTRTLCLTFRGPDAGGGTVRALWFAEVDDAQTTIWAQFEGVNPNEAQVEINVRQAVFYPEKPGINYLTVRGFTLEHAATPWAPPTAEQVGLIGTHWSKGWIIESNRVRYSVCSGISLGKHGDEFDNTSQNSAEGYVETIKRATARGWSKENIGHHIVRHNHISHCEQAGIVGSMGPVFSTITGNTIHDIHVRRLFSGAEMAGIKFHGAVDTVISQNHIYRTTRGIWLDWMAQGTHVTRNLLHDNGPSEDLFVEVNHGPFLVDNNIFLSRNSLLVNSQGGAYVHNLMTGRVRVLVGERRKTPYLKEHSTEVAGLAGNLSGDERFYNNVFVNGGLAEYDRTKLPVFMGGNVFLNGARPSKYEPNPVWLPDVDPGLELLTTDEGMELALTFDPAWARKPCTTVTTELLGKAKTPGLPYVQPDGSPYRIDTDYFGRRRSVIYPGPFAEPEVGRRRVKVW